MAHQADPKPWYRPGDVAGTVQEAIQYGSVSTGEIVDHLADQELDAPLGRIRKMVETARDQVSEKEETTGTQTTLDDPRALTSRFVDASDVGFLGSRDFATLLGAVLSRYEGSFRRPEDIDELDVDLFWNRQHTTIAFRTISRPQDNPVDKSDVTEVVEGTIASSTGRSPSIVGIVSNTGFTASAEDLAADADLELFGKEYVSSWFNDARLTPDILGTLLEEGEQNQEEVEAILAELPPLPAFVQETDPLADVAEAVWQPTTDTETRPNTKQRMPITEEHPPAGQRGELYADPTEDGDYSAFDRFMDELQEDTE